MFIALISAFALYLIITLYLTYVGKDTLLMTVFLVILAILIIPIVVAWSVPRVPSKAGGDSAWIGFWGSYLGSIVGVAGAALFAWINTKMQIQKQAQADFNNQVLLVGLSTINELARIISGMYTKITLLKRDFDITDSNGEEADIKALIQNINSEIEIGMKNYNKTVLALIVDDEEWTTELQELDEASKKLKLFKSSGNYSDDVVEIQNLSDEIIDDMWSLIKSIKISYDKKIERK